MCFSLSLLICFTLVSSVHFPTDTSKSFLLSLSLSPPSSPLTVKVILIKSSRRTELLIAPRRSGWFQIQIKARRLFFFSFFFPKLLSPPLHLCSTMLNTIWVLAVWTVITRPRPPLPLRTGGWRWRGEWWIFHPHDHRMISNWHTRARVHAHPRALPP